MTPSDAVQRHRDEIRKRRSADRPDHRWTIGRVLGHAEASTIFGRRQRRRKCTIVPVGRVSSRYGFGNVAARERAAGPTVIQGGGGGGGGGGQLDVKPIGYIEITSDGSRFVDITDTSAVAIRAVTMGGVNRDPLRPRSLPDDPLAFSEDVSFSPVDTGPDSRALAGPGLRSVTMASIQNRVGRLLQSLGW
ncbi:MAG: hypothetical protein R2849_21075 [Thermomicrobiales bacterium]